MSVRERVREVGVLKTLGYTPGIILGVILGEAVAISFIGGLIGCGLAELLCRVVRHGPALQRRPRPAVHWCRPWRWRVWPWQ